MNSLTPKRILISRPDSIGDVVLTLPMAGALKARHPGVQILFLGRTYTEPVVRQCTHVDTFVCLDDLSRLGDFEQVEAVRRLSLDVVIHVFPHRHVARLMKQAGVSVRIGTSHRLFHWLTCNRRVSFSRRHSRLHEAQLNFKLLAPLGMGDAPPLYALAEWYGLVPPTTREQVGALIDPKKFNLIIHPKSRGSAREWGMDNYCELLRILPPGKIRVLVTGTSSERASVPNDLFIAYDDVVDTCGRFDLAGLIELIGAADGLLACSTGPLHLAAALGKNAIGIYAPMKPIDPDRWAPIGPRAQWMCVDRVCSDCRRTSVCHCISDVSPVQVANRIELLVKAGK